MSTDFIRYALNGPVMGTRWTAVIHAAADHDMAPLHADLAAAVAQAENGDTVIVLGKGHESGQEIAGVVTDFDDRIQLAMAIEAKR